jgi:release factor glutamine methyltransferase
VKALAQDRRRSVSSLLGWAVGVLTSTRFPEGRIEAELLLARATGLRRIDLYAEPGRAVSNGEAAEFEALVQKRIGRIPVQHLIEEQEFWGRPFWTPPGTFIPRPETELLIEGALDLFRDRPPERVLDLGTGTGCIAITLAILFPSAKVFAVDRSARALAVARHNAEKHRVGGRVRFLCGDLGRPLRIAAAHRFDLIVSNPPYLGEHERSTLEPEVAEHDPPEALFAGPSGMEIIERILRETPLFLAPGGSILLEFGAVQGEKVRRVAQRLGFDIRIQKDYAELERVARLRLLAPSV